MYLNILHRTAGGILATGTGYEIYRKQQALAHRLGLKTTMLLHYHDLFDEKVLDDVRRDHDEHGDEIGLALHKLDGPGLTELSHGLRSFWLFSRERKRQMLEMIVGKWREVFGKAPESVAAYHFDASALDVLREFSPETRTIVGGCFEEGVRVFHGCNHSWYLFNEGMPIAPWYPAKNNSLRPAENEADAAGVVAVPHLSRDMALSYEGRNDFWASHPPNVMRGMGNDASFCPYDLNLIDQYRMQADFNDGFAYYNIFVNVGWLMANRNLEYPPEVAWELYEKQLGYLAGLKNDGQVTDMTMAEFGAWFREHRPLGKMPADVYLAKEMLYGSGKHYVWLCDAKRRVLIDCAQGGSIGDLRPYAAKLPVETGPDTPAMAMGSYPYLIQSQHRTGMPNHYTDGTRTTLLLRHGGQQVDLGTVVTKCASLTHDANGNTTVKLTPARVTFDDGYAVTVQTTFTLAKAGDLKVLRELTDATDDTPVELEERFKGCWGTSEYPEKLHDVLMHAGGEPAVRETYRYEGRSFTSAGTTFVAVDVPSVKTRAWLVNADEGQKPVEGRLTEGHLFDPYYVMSLIYTAREGQRISTWLKLTRI